jgi:hypothetical protein
LAACAAAPVARAEPRPQGVALEDLAKLHALTPELGARLVGLDLGLRYRFAAVRDERFPGMPESRFNAMLDFLF